MRNINIKNMRSGTRGRGGAIELMPVTKDRVVAPLMVCVELIVIRISSLDNDQVII